MRTDEGGAARAKSRRRTPTLARTSVPAATLTIRRGVPRWVEREVRRVFMALLRLSEPTKPVRVLVVPYPAIGDEGDGTGFGATHVSNDGTGTADIYLAGDLAAVQREHKIPRAEMMRHIGETLTHEWAHYEQWRDGKAVTERGVRVRASSLYRRVG